VEGHEYPALRGAEQTIGGHRSFVLFEQLASEFKGGSSPVIELSEATGIGDSPQSPDGLDDSNLG
jgi:hypothetical protein